MDVREKLSAAEAKESPEHFLRGQRRGSRSRRLRLGRGLVRWTVATAVTLGLVALGVWGAAAMSRAPELTVDRVRVEGNERLSDGEILELLELSAGSNILTLDLDEVREKLLRSAWVRDVSLERVLPATLTLSIEEREPVAVAVLGELYLLAGDGTVLDLVSPHAAIAELPVARGLLVAGSEAAERLELAGRVASAIASEPRLGRLVSEIDVGDGEGSIAVRLRTPSLTMLVTEVGGIDRLRETVPLIDGVVERFPLLEVVDLRFQGRMYLRLGTGSHETGLQGGDDFVSLGFWDGFRKAGDSGRHERSRLSGPRLDLKGEAVSTASGECLYNSSSYYSYSPAFLDSCIPETSSPTFLPRKAGRSGRSVASKSIFSSGGASF